MVKSSIDWSPIRRLMKKSGADLVARSAVNELIESLEKNAEDITQTAIKLAQNAHRKKVTSEDIKLAIDLV